ncbi:MAG: exodeoxyribonuclease VII large subunit [Dysgonamonadaceae bacterium]|jgi:exodeoxyribonuclease VII large subunit|nr:exodeoxyribonuclease VII large subunit [Dysgonamonadaceae bacterium]
MKMEFITLSQLNILISQEIKRAFPDTYWIMAETSDVRLNRTGHCYLELIEKSRDLIIAKVSAHVWHSTFQLLKPYFEEATGQTFVSGIKVLVCVSIDFHPLYGYSLNILDIDPTYTIGDIKQHRQQILDLLDKEGVLNLNRELELPPVPQRIAIISSSTAAGYEDFLNHLQTNKHHFVFYPVLYPAVMQGTQTTGSIIAALNKIYENQDSFDAVVIIRGGGASSDLASFDSYELAVNCAQFPLPIITGIGHERDDTVLDLIANHRAKTPTAVADYLISKSEEFFSSLQDIQSDIWEFTRQLLTDIQENLDRISYYLPMAVRSVVEKQEISLLRMKENIQRTVDRYIHDREKELQTKENFLKLSSPEYILSKGYSITLKNGKALKTSDGLKAGDVVETVLSKGKFESIVSSGN